MGDLHGMFKCPCGQEFGGLTDHPQTERLCETHASGSGYIGGEPEFAGKSDGVELGKASWEQFKQTLPPEQAAKLNAADAEVAAAEEELAAASADAKPKKKK
jgi:hypothetical protein